MFNFHPILFKLCAYVNNMLIYNMHRERAFPLKINNLAALFHELFECPSYKPHATFNKLIHDMMKQVFGVSDQVRHVGLYSLRKRPEA